MIRGKKYKQLQKLVNKNVLYPLDEAIQLTKKTSYSKFEGTFELVTKVNYKSLQNVRGTLLLPHGTGKDVKVLVFCKENKQEEAKQANADYIGSTELIKKIKEGWIDFDACVSTPDMMKEVGRLGSFLGRKGLMPKPKSGTVTNDIKKAVSELKSGKVEYKPDKSGCIHFRVGKINFEDKKIAENTKAVVNSLLKNKPSDSKGNYLVLLSLSSTMGLGIKVDLKKMINS